MTNAFIHGAAVGMSWQDASRSLTDLIFDGVSAALHDAGVPIAEVDSVVLAAHDLIDGRSLSSMVTAPAAGAYLRDEIRLSEDGLAALSFATARVEAGEAGLSVVAAWARASEGGFLPVSRASMDAFLEQPFGLTDIDVSAFRLSRWAAQFGDGGSERRRAAYVRQERARRHPRALGPDTGAVPPSYPVRSEEVPRWADITVAMIIGPNPAPVRVAGVAHGTEAPRIGERDLLLMPALAAAASTAMVQASVARPDVLEIDGLTLSDEAIALEALGFCAPGDGFSAYAIDHRVNASGGSAAGWCYPAMGLVRAAEAYFRLRTAAKGAALVTGLGGNAGQTSTAAVLAAA